MIVTQEFVEDFERLVREQARLRNRVQALMLAAIAAEQAIRALPLRHRIGLRHAHHVLKDALHR